MHPLILSAIRRARGWGYSLTAIAAYLHTTRQTVAFHLAQVTPPSLAHIFKNAPGAPEGPSDTQQSNTTPNTK